MKIPSKKRNHPSKYAGISPSVLLKRRFMLGSVEDRKRDVECNGDKFCKTRSNEIVFFH